MKTLLKELARISIAIVMSLVYAWFLLSFAWSIDEMSKLEKCAGIVYGFVMVPLYCKLTDAIGLR